MKSIVIIFVLTIILSGCGVGERYEFSGNSENWEVFYEVEVPKENRQEGTGTIEYTGDEPIPEKFDYEVKTKDRSLEVFDRELSVRKINFSTPWCDMCSFDKEDEVLIEITWNGQTETLLLTTKD